MLTCSGTVSQAWALQRSFDRSSTLFKAFYIANFWFRRPCAGSLARSGLELPDVVPEGAKPDTPVRWQVLPLLPLDTLAWGPMLPPWTPGRQL
jgi:hypothetical protein